MGMHSTCDGFLRVGLCWGCMHAWMDASTCPGGAPRPVPGSHCRRLRGACAAQGWGENDRGVSYTFGPDCVSDFLAKHDLDLICRAHQVGAAGARAAAGGGGSDCCRCAAARSQGQQEAGAAARALVYIRGSGEAGMASNHHFPPRQAAVAQQ
jgi:hypothetical protein